MEELKQLLYDECMYKMPDEVLDRFLNVMSEVRLKDKEALIPYGQQPVYPEERYNPVLLFRRRC